MGKKRKKPVLHGKGTPFPRSAKGAFPMYKKKKIAKKGAVHE